MGAYADFRLILSPDLATQGNWTLTLDECPLPELVGPKGSVAPTVTRAHLNTLRSRNGWPNPVGLEQVGRAVWQSVMTPAVEGAFAASLQTVVGNQQGLRFVLVLQGQESETTNQAAIRLSELPVEALYNDAHQFMATDVKTPISRSFQWKPDRPPQRVILPLRVLVAMASPTDKPPTNIEQEIQAIQSSVEHLTGSGALELEIIQQAERATVAARLKAKPFHVLHFIGHGGFDVVGDVEVPRAHLCFVRPGNSRSDPTDADTLLVMLRNTGVRLVVITACSSAAPTPPLIPEPLDPGPLGTGAFEGVAQRLVAGVSGVTAAVAMQFDLEDIGAVEFSKVFYENLLQPGLALDEVVTMARQALVTLLQAGHRAWLTPAVHWRCQGGNVFEIDPTVRQLDAQTLGELQAIDTQLAVYREYVQKIEAEPAAVRTAVNDLRLEWIMRIQQLMSQRGELVGESVRLQGARVAAGQEATCRLSLRMRQPGTVGLINLRVQYPDDRLVFAGSDAGSNVGGPPAIAPLSAGVLQMVFVNPSGGQSWSAGEYELGFLRFSVLQGSSPGVVDVQLASPVITRNGQEVAIAPADGVLFIESVEAVQAGVQVQAIQSGITGGGNVTLHSGGDITGRDSIGRGSADREGPTRST
jgi:hypothetical protein